MTPEELTALVHAGKPSEVVAAMAPLDEPTRRKLSKTAAGFKKSMDEAWWYTHHSLCAQLAMLAACPRSTLSTAHLLNLRWEIDLVFEVLDARRPDWLGQLIEDLLEKEFHWLSWTLVHRLVNAGVCAKPTGPGYTSLFAAGVQYEARGKDRRRLGDLLLESPELLEDEIWRLFEVEAPIHEKHGWSGSETWHQALVRLCDEGHIDRDRLLDASLAAVWKVSATHALNGYVRFHRLLEPKIDEIAARESGYRDLLSHRLGHVAGLGVEMLGKLARKADIDANATLEAIRPTLALEQKSHAVAAVRLLKRIAKRYKDLAAEVARSATEGLVHPVPDVQAKTLELLVELGSSLPPDVVARLTETREELAPQLRALLDPVLGGDAVPPPVSASDHAKAVTALAAEISELPAAARARLPESPDVTDLPPPLALSSADLGDLGDDNRIEPIATVDELIDAVSHMLEVVDSADEVERIIDAITRLCGERPPDFAKRTAPLRKRLDDLSDWDESYKRISAAGIPPALMGLVLTWVHGKRTRREIDEQLESALYKQLRGTKRFLELRLAQLIERVGKRTAAPTLAAPTHKGGWIDPRTLVERARKLASLGIEPTPTDVTQALLRIAPAHKEDALDQAMDLRADYARCLRYALGSPELPRANDPAAWRLAAWRCREPREPAPRTIFEQNGWPGADTTASIVWKADLRVEERGQSKYTHPILRIACEPECPHPDSGPTGFQRIARSFTALLSKKTCALSECPTVLVYEREPTRVWGANGMTSDWAVQWTRSVWPTDTDGFGALAVAIARRRLDADSSTLEPLHPLVEILFDRARALTEIATLLLWLGLSAKDADFRAASVDAMIAIIDSGRANPRLFATVWAKLAEPGWLKPNRIADSFAEVARVSGVHELTLVRTLEHYLARSPVLPRGAHHLLEVLLASLTDLGLGLCEDAKQTLSAITGSSKTAKLARELRGRSTEKHNKAREVVLDAWRQRIAQAERLAAHD